MSEPSFKYLLTIDEPLRWEYPEPIILGDEYLLLDCGVLLDNEGKVIWNTKLDHHFSDAVYIRDKQIFLTNRVICFGMGGAFDLGITCIDMNNGKYKWKHFYDPGFTRINLRKKGPDINMVRRIEVVDTGENCLYSDGFKIDLDDGSYVYTGVTKRRLCGDKNVLYPHSPKSFKESLHSNTKNTSMINIKIDHIYINNQEFSKEGYFFNKCDFIMSSDEHLYFFGTPAKKNPKNTILFKFSKTLNKIIEEIELPFRKIPSDVYDFFGKGLLIIAGSTLWLFEDFYL